MAVAVSLDGGSAASTALGALVETRVAAAGFRDAVARPHDLGFQVSTLVRDAAEAARFVDAAARALSSPVTQNEAGVAAAHQRLEALKARTWTGTADAEVARCTAELGIPQGSTPPEAGPAELERWRAAAYSFRSVAFAVLGPLAVLDAATNALEHTAEWPDAPAPDDPWPTSDPVGSTPANPQSQRLSLALRVADAPRALAAAKTLGERSTVLAARLGALEPAWHLDRIVATTRPRGACLRLDARAEGKSTELGADDVARVAALLRGEAESTLAHARGDWWAVEDGVLRATDPREATSVAAWRALCGREAGGPTRSAVSFVGRISAKGDLARAMAREQRERTTHFVDQRARIEPGQGEMWVLLASPCGTAGESNEDAGLAALTLQTLALRRPSVQGVVIEPWIDSDGVGLLAHAPRSSPNETSAELAQRVADALGRALAATRLAAPQVAQARANLLERVGPRPRPAFWLTVDALAPGHPAWLSPRGSFAALSGIQSHEVETSRRTLARGPLRMAAIANSDPGQVETARTRLEEWIRPLRGQPLSCPKHAAPKVRHGALTLESEDASSAGRAYVAAALPAGSRISTEAEMLSYLLNRPGGYLDQALSSTTLGSARALLLGGRRAQALIIEVHAFEDRESDAIAQVRGLLGRLARGALSQKDLDLAREELSRAELGASLDPRQRILELWRGEPRRSPSLASMRRFLATALRPEAQIVVRVKLRE